MGASILQNIKFGLAASGVGLYFGFVVYKDHHEWWLVVLAYIFGLILSWLIRAINRSKRFHAKAMVVRALWVVTFVLAFEIGLPADSAWQGMVRAILGAIVGLFIRHLFSRFNGLHRKRADSNK